MWSEIIETILRLTGKSEPWLAEQVGTSQSTINRLRNGRPSCEYNLGKALVSLRDEVVGRASNTDRRRTSDRRAVPSAGRRATDKGQAA